MWSTKTCLVLWLPMVTYLETTFQMLLFYHLTKLQIDVDKMFSNIVDIYEVNRTFWTKCLQPLLREGRTHRRPLNPLRLRDGFIHFEELFEPYIKYCLEQATCLAYVKENRHESVLFKSYVAVSLGLASSALLIFRTLSIELLSLKVFS